MTGRASRHEIELEVEKQSSSPSDIKPKPVAIDEQDKGDLRTRVSDQAKDARALCPSVFPPPEIKSGRTLHERRRHGWKDDVGCRC